MIALPTGGVCTVLNLFFIAGGVSVDYRHVFREEKTP